MKALLIFSLLIFPFFVSAQDDKKNVGTISGSVSTADGQAAPYVSIRIKNTGQGTITDEKGNFEIKKIKPGIYILNVSLSGYIDSAINIEIKQNETFSLKIQLSETYAALKTIIVAATPRSSYVETKISESLHLNLPLNEIPQNISITSKQLIFDQGLLSMSEAIRTASGVVKTYGGLNDYTLIIRGTDANWNVFRNGVGGYWWNQQEDAAMLEKIEFIKGPAGFIVSIAEPGGIVNNITKQPIKERIANIDEGYGSYNMMRIAADFSGPIDQKEKFTYRINVGAHNQERAFQFSKAYRYFICAAVKYEPDKKTSITAEYNYMRGKTSGNNTDVPSMNGKMFLLPENFAIADATTDAIKTKDAYYRLQLKHNFNDNWHLFAQAAYVHGTWGGYMLDADDDVPVSNDTLYRASNFDDSRNFSAVAQAYIDGKFYTGHKIEHKILAGIDYCNAGFTDLPGRTLGDQEFGLYLKQPQYYVSLDSLKNFLIGPKTTVKWGWTSLYLQDNIKIAGKLVITLATHLTHAPLYGDNPGGVPDYQKNTHHDAISPRAGLTWLFSDNVSVYTLYDDCFWPQQEKNFQQKPFEPLTGYDIETGLKSYFFKKKLSLNFSLFDIVKNNTLTADPLHFGDFIQTGQIISKGIDFDMTGNITPALTVNANYSYADAKITKDSDPNNVGMKNFGTPDYYGNLWLKYNVLRGKLKNVSFAIGYQHMGRRNAEVNWIPGDEINFLPVYNVFDAALAYCNEKFRINLNVYNITNTNYAVVGSFNSAINEWRYTPGEPVNFRLSFGVNLVRGKK